MAHDTPTTTAARPGTATRAMAPVVGLGTLRRLAELDSGARPILSVYLPLDPTAVTACEAELAALSSWSSSYASQAEVERVHEFLRSLPAFAHGTRSLGLFSHAGGSKLEVVPLPERVAAMTVSDTQAWIEPLADMLCPDDSGVAVVAPCCARLFRGGARGLVEFAVVREEARNRDLDGENSLGSPCLLAGASDSAIASRLARLLRRADGRRAFDTLVVAAPPRLWPAIAEALPGALASRLAGCVALDPREAPAREAARALSLLREQGAPSGDIRACSTPTGDRGQAIAISQDTWPCPRVMSVARPRAPHRPASPEPVLAR